MNCSNITCPQHLRYVLVVDSNSHGAAGTAKTCRIDAVPQSAHLENAESATAVENTCPKDRSNSDTFLVRLLFDHNTSSHGKSP